MFETIVKLQNEAGKDASACFNYAPCDSCQHRTFTFGYSNQSSGMEICSKCMRKLIQEMERHEEREVLKRVAAFLYEESSCNYELTKIRISDLSITKVKVNGDEIEIHTARPGILIGRRGERIEKLANCFPNHKLKIFETNLVEDQLMAIIEDHNPEKDY